MPQDGLREYCHRLSRSAMLAMVAALGLASTASALSGGKPESDPALRGAYLLKVSTQGPVSTCSGVAVRPRVIMTAAHCVLSGVSNKGAEISRKVDIHEGKDLPPIATSTSIHVSANFEKFVRENARTGLATVKDFKTYASDLAALSDQAFIVLDRPVAHSPSLLDLVDRKAMEARGGKEGSAESADIQAYVALLRERFYGGNDTDPVFVGFGFTQCPGRGDAGCSGYGTRRSAHVKVTSGQGCDSQMYTLSYFCIFPDPTLAGDSGGPLYLRGKDGKRYAVGILSGRRGSAVVPTMMLAARMFTRLERQGFR